jgi:hypothetical protein
LFVPFERLDAEVRGIEGTGLGLAVTKGLVDAMDGVIGVESELRRGTVFWFELPSSVAAIPPAPADPDTAPTSLPSSGERRESAGQPTLDRSARRRGAPVLEVVPVGHDERPAPDESPPGERPPEL